MTEPCLHTTGITTLLSGARAAGLQPLCAEVMELTPLFLLFHVLCHSTRSFTAPTQLSLRDCTSQGAGTPSSARQV